MSLHELLFYGSHLHHGAKWANFIFLVYKEWGFLGGDGGPIKKGPSLKRKNVLIVPPSTFF